MFSSIEFTVLNIYYTYSYIRNERYTMDENQKNDDISQDHPPLNNNIPNDNQSNTPHEINMPKPATQPYVNSPVAQPADVTKPKNINSPGLITLQWLTYAFWGATVLTMSVLTALVLSFYLLENAETGEPSLYTMAAAIVLLPLSVICDFIYIKREPEKKTGFAAVVMVIHAIIFALLGIGSLIVVAFSLMNLLTSSSETEGTTVILYSSIIITFLYAILFIRTLLPKKLFKMRFPFIILMIVVVGIICTFGIIGPVADTRLTRNDRLIVSNISTVSESIDDYANDNKKLPDSLDVLTLTGDAKKLVTDKLVSYKQDATPIFQSIKDCSDSSSSLYDCYSENQQNNAFYYQLCATYKKASSSQYSSDTTSSSLSEINGGYSTYPSTYSHPAGEKCYKLITNNNSYDYETQSSIYN